MPNPASAHATLDVPPSLSETHLGPVAEEGRVLVIFGNSLVIKVDRDGPVMFSKGLVALQLERGGRFLIGSHYVGGVKMRGVQEDDRCETRAREGSGL